MHNHTGCICLTFLHCGSSNVPIKNLDQSMQNHTGCICLTFLHCGFSNALSKSLPECMHNHTGCICLTFLHCGSSNVSLNCLPKRRFVWFFSTVLATALWAPMTGNGFSPLWATNFLQCVLKPKIIIPRPSSVPSSVKRPAHWLQSFSLRVNIPMMKGGLLCYLRLNIHMMKGASSAT